MKDCDAASRAIIDEFSSYLVGNVSKSAKEMKWGAWVPACVKHVFEEYDWEFSKGIYAVPANSNNTISETINKWI